MEIVKTSSIKFARYVLTFEGSGEPLLVPKIMSFYEAF